MTAAKRAAQFPDNMTQGNDVLCKRCWAVVKWEEKSLFLPISWQHWLHLLRLPIRIRHCTHGLTKHFT